MGTLFETAQLLSMLIGLLLPILNGLVTRWDNSTGRTYLQLVLAAVAGFGTEWIDALTNAVAYDWRQAAVGYLVTLVTSIAVQAGVWRPLGVSDAAKRALTGGPRHQLEPPRSVAG